MEVSQLMKLKEMETELAQYTRIVDTQYHRDFSVRSDMQLGTYQDIYGFSSLSELLKSHHGRK